MYGPDRTLVFIMVVSAMTCAAAPETGIYPRGCTVFSVAKEGRVLFGGNDDYINPDSWYWVDPGEGGRYGAIWIGRPDNVQQGVNEKGLAYDANGLQRVDVNPHNERLPVAGGYTSYPLHILHECATVDEVIRWVRTHRWHSYMHDQMHFADATGDAVIISAGADGEIAFTRKSPGNGFLVSTNFNVADPVPGITYPCRRYERASDLLGRLIRDGTALSVSDAAGVLEAVHVESGNSWTIESMVADLTSGTVYLYYFHQFQSPVVLNVQEELTAPRPAGPLSGLFPEEVRREAARRHRAIQARAGSCRLAALVWLGLTAASLLAVLFSGRKGGRKGFRILSVVVLGPLALPALFLAGYSRHDAFTEAAGDLLPTVIAFPLSLILIVVIPRLQGPGILPLLLIFGASLLGGLLLVQGPLLFSSSGTSGLKFLTGRLPHVLTAVNLGLAGVAALSAPLIMHATRVCTLFPVRFLTLASVWTMGMPGAFLGMLLLFPYARWLTRHDYRAWSCLMGRDGSVRSPSWGVLRWWLPLSAAALLAGLAASVILSQQIIS